MMSQRQQFASNASGIDDAAVARMVEHIQAGTTDLAEDDLHVPLAHFTCPQHAARERDLLRSLPLVVGVGTEIPEPGDFLTRRLMGANVLIVRQSDGSVRAHLNRCPHRGGKVELAESGNKPVFVCSYHGWAFNRDGALRAIPPKQSYGEMCAAHKSLVSLGIAERHNLLWLRLDSDEAPDMAEFLGEEVDRQLSAVNLDSSAILLRKTFTLPVNWKLVVDGTADVMHPPFLHPTGVAKVISSAATVWLDYGRHGQLINARVKLVDRLRAGEAVTDPRRYFTTNLILYPNSWLITTPDHLEFWTVWPDPADPSRCEVDIRFLVAEADRDERTVERLERSWEFLAQALFQEDFPMEELIQENALQGAGPPFLYGRSELPCQLLHRQLKRDLGDAGC